MFLGNQVVGRDYLLFAPSHSIVCLPMLIVPRGWWIQWILHSIGFFQLFSVRRLFLLGLLFLRHMFQLVLVPSRRISLVPRDIVHVVVFLISRVFNFSVV